MLDARLRIARLSLFIENFVWNLRILNPKNNAAMDHKRNRYQKWELIWILWWWWWTLKLYKSLHILISEINTICSWMKLWNEVQFWWPLSTIIIYFTFSIHHRLSLELKSQGQKRTRQQHPRSLSLTQTRVNDTRDPRFSQQWQKEHHCLLRCDSVVWQILSQSNLLPPYLDDRRISQAWKIKWIGWHLPPWRWIKGIPPKHLIWSSRLCGVTRTL